MEVIIASPRGFCAGVVRAIEVVEKSLDTFDSPVYVRKEIVHNPHVVQELREKGAIFVDDIKDVPEGQTVVFSAHGVSPDVWRNSENRKLNIMDATCPLVTKVHAEAIKYAKEGYTILLVGHQGHEEVEGTMGEAPESTILVEDSEFARSVQIVDESKVVALTQTTLSLDDTKDIIGILRERFPTLVTRNDICYATTNRQIAVKAMASKVDLVLVIGAQNSSNCNRLREVASGFGIPAYLINGPDDISYEWFADVGKVGITSGASTPERLVTQVVEKLNPTSIQYLELVDENVSFVLPKELR
jgi:4-hydroxy-3-methylbut-2-enyl diphosphate reductase